jgi:ATP-dependent RNA helicase DeaD
MPNAVWFRLDIGRTKNADPKWLLPMLCKKGGVQREDIGAIRIFPTDTKVEISADAAESFLKNMRKPGPDKVGVERVGAGSGAGSGGAEAQESRPPREKKKYEGKKPK